MELVLSFGLIAIAILALIAVFASGVKLSAQARNITVATELGKQTLERIRSSVKTAGFIYIPSGSYTFDGKAGQAQTGAPPYPPAPYPSTAVNSQLFFVVVSGEEPVPDRLKRVRVEVYWDQQAHITLETVFHP